MQIILCDHFKVGKIVKNRAAIVQLSCNRLVKSAILTLKPTTSGRTTACKRGIKYRSTSGVTQGQALITSTRGIQTDDPLGH